MARLKYGNQYSQYPKKYKKQPVTRNKLASQWMASRDKTEKMTMKNIFSAKIMYNVINI